MKMRTNRLHAVAVLAAAGCGASALGLPINGRVRVATYTVDPNGNVNAPADPAIASDFLFANAIWNQVGISFLNDGNTTIAVNTPAVAAGWNRVSFNNTLNTAARARPTGFAYYVVDNYKANTGTLGTTWSQDDVGQTVSDSNGGGGPAGPSNPISTRTIVARQVRGGSDVLAHEFGHMLSNRYEWRTFEQSGAAHSNVANNLMLPNPQNPAIGGVWPAGTSSQITHTVGKRGFNSGDGARMPFITASYNDGAGGGTAGSAMFDAVNRDSIQINMGQNNSTSVDSVDWGNTLNITKPTAGGGTRTYSVDQTARREQNSRESLAFFVTSPSVLTTAADLLAGWSFGAIGIDSLDGQYQPFSSVSVSIRAWSDILGPGASNSNGGAGDVIDPTAYAAYGSINAFGQLTFNVFFYPASAVVLNGYRDLQFVTSVAWVPAPGAAGVLALWGVMASRRRRR